MRKKALAETCCVQLFIELNHRVASLERRLKRWSRMPVWLSSRGVPLIFRFEWGRSTVSTGPRVGADRNRPNDALTVG